MMMYTSRYEPRGANWWSLGICGVLLWLSVLAADIGVEADMSDLTLNLTSAQVDWVSGEAITLSATVTNTGAVATELPSVGSGGFLSLRIESADGTANYQDGAADRARRPDAPAIPPLQTSQPLGKGEERAYLVSFDRFVNTPLKVGTYTVSVRFEWEDQQIWSPPVTLYVVPLNPAVSYSIHEIADASLLQVVLHEAPGGRVALVRRSEPRHPAAGGFRRIAEGLDTQASVATTVPTRSLISRYHAAVLAGDVLLTGIGTGPLRQETPFALSQAQLHPVGWQLSPFSAEFVALGRSSTGIAMAILTLPAKDRIPGPPELVEIDLPLDALPDHWSVQRDAPSQRYRLIAAYGARLVAVDITPNGAGPLEEIAELDGPLHAMAVYPIKSATEEDVAAIPDGETNYARGAPANAIDVVVGPYLHDGQEMFQLARVAMSDGTVAVKQAFLIPDAWGDQLPNWRLSTTTGPTVEAAGLVSGNVIVVDGEGGSNIVTDDVPGGDSLRLDWFGSAFVVGWVDSDGNPRFLGLE